MGLVWAPQAGPQKALIDCPVYEIFYGGARGGGKTDGVLGKMALKALRYGAAFNCLFVRRELPMLDDAIARSHQIFGPLGGGWNEQKKTWMLPGGGRFRFRPLERERDAEKYQGQNISDVCVEEAGNYPDPRPIQKLHGVLRSAAGIPTQMHLTGNPGGPGQQWINERYVAPAPNGMRVVREVFHVEGRDYERSRVYIPARLRDNPLLMKNDPNYIANLHMVGSAALVKAWLNGDWGAIEGAFFDVWDTARHVLRPAALPEHWMRFRSGDWGSAKPFSFGWWAVASEDWRHPDGALIPRGAMVRYREWYGCVEGKANTGLKLTAEEVGRRLAAMEVGDMGLEYGVLDPAAFAEDGGPSLAERIYLGSGNKVRFRRADNARVSQRGAMGGWDTMRGRLIGDGDGRSMIYCFSTCTHSIRTIPALQHDKDRAEDLDTDGEDHAADEWRYGVMSRPWLRKAPLAKAEAKKIVVGGQSTATLDDLWKQQQQPDQWRV